MIIVGVSDETEEKLAEYVQAKDVRFTIVRAPGAMQKFGGKFYPSFFTVGPRGEILTVPEQRIPAESVIEDALRDVVTLPDLPEDSRYSALRKIYKKSQWKKVDDYFQRMLANDNLDAEMRTVLEHENEAFQRKIQSQSARVETLAEGPDFYAAKTRLDLTVKEYKGLPPGTEATAVLKRFGKDPAIKKEISAGRDLAKLLKRYDASKFSGRKKLAEALQKFRKNKKYKGTVAASQAMKRVAGLR